MTFWISVGLWVLICTQPCRRLWELHKRQARV